MHQHRWIGAEDSYPNSHDERFLGHNLVAWLPDDLETESRVWLDFTHFSVLYDTSIKSAVLAAANVDGNQLRASYGSRKFRYAKVLPKNQQRGSEWYRDDPFDRGHLVRRSTVRWGAPSVAKLAERESDFFVNIVPQITAVHQDEWKAIERAILLIIMNQADNRRALVFSGVYYDPENKMYDPVNRPGTHPVKMRLVPNAMWKALVYYRSGELQKLHFWVRQDTPTTTTSSRDFLLSGMDVRQFVVEEQYIDDMMGFRYDGKWEYIQDHSE